MSEREEGEGEGEGKEGRKNVMEGERERGGGIGGCLATPQDLPGGVVGVKVGGVSPNTAEEDMYIRTGQMLAADESMLPALLWREGGALGHTPSRGN